MRSPTPALAVAAAGMLSLMSPGLVRAAAPDTPRVIPEVPVTATDLRRAEAHNSPVVIADPDRPRFMALAYRADAPEFTCGLEVSGDGGRGWVGAEPVPELPPGADRCYAPEVAFDGRGRLLYLFVGLAGPGNAPMGVFLTSSDDNGRTWAPPARVLGAENYQVRLAIDRSGGGRGRIHVVWLQAGADPPLGGMPAGVDNPILAMHSDDGGATFSDPVRVSDPARPRSVAPAVALGPDGAVHVAYYDLRDDVVDYQGLEGPTWPGEWSMVVATSLDRGRTFGPGVVVDDAIVPPGRVMLIFTMPPPALAADRSGAVFVAWIDARRGDPDVVLSRSTDAGRTWMGPERVNDDPVGNGRDQALVRLSVAAGGRVDAVFLDRRDDPDNLANHTYFAFSTDRGARFSPNVRLSSEPSDSRIGQRYLIPSAKGLVELGSRLGLVSLPGAALAAWPDTRNALVGENTQDILATEVLIGGGGDDPGPSPAAVAAGALAVAVVVGAFVAAARRRRGPA